jgi:hypothetical protein
VFLHHFQGLTLVEADDIQMLGKLSALLRASPSSLMSRLLEAVSQSDYALVERRCNKLTRRAASLKDFIEEPALRRSKNKEASRYFFIFIPVLLHRNLLL